MRYNFTSRGLCIVDRKNVLCASVSMAGIPGASFARISTLFKPFIEFITITKTDPFTAFFAYPGILHDHLTVISETLLYLYYP